MWPLSVRLQSDEAVGGSLCSQFWDITCDVLLRQFRGGQLKEPTEWCKIEWFFPPCMFHVPCFASFEGNSSVRTVQFCNGYTDTQGSGFCTQQRYHKSGKVFARHRWTSNDKWTHFMILPGRGVLNGTGCSSPQLIPPSHFPSLSLMFPGCTDVSRTQMAERIWFPVPVGLVLSTESSTRTVTYTMKHSWIQEHLVCGFSVLLCTQNQWV